MRALAIALIAALGFVGCSAPSGNPKLVGTYVATNAESLVFLPDTRVLHVRVVDGREQRVLVGYTAFVSGASDTISIIAPDTSPFVGTRFQVDTNFTTITVDWRDLRSTNDVRQSYFHRKSDG